MSGELVGHDALRKTPEGVLKKAQIDLIDRCRSIIILGRYKEDDESDHYLRCSDMTNAEVCELAAFLNAYIHDTFIAKGWRKT